MADHHPSTINRAITRSRSSSLQKGAAVLRALSRAESDFDLSTTSDPISTSVQTQSSSIRNRSSQATPTTASLKPPLPTKSSSSSSSSSSSNKSWEIPRKIFHSSHGLIVVYLYLSNANLDTILRNLTYFLAVVVTADLIRLNNPSFESLYEYVLGFLMRESEKEKVNGVVWYLIGVITSLHFFPQDIACVSIMILSWADTSASTFGRLFGRYTPPLPSPPFARRKSLAGFLAAMLTGALTTYFFWCTSIAARGARPNGLSWSGSGFAHPPAFGTPRASGTPSTGWQGWSTGFVSDPNPTTNLPGMPSWLLTLGTGLVAAVAEALELGGVDDNLSLPILSASGIWFLLYAWGRFASWWFTP